MDIMVKKMKLITLMRKYILIIGGLFYIYILYKTTYDLIFVKNITINDATILSKMDEYMFDIIDNNNRDEKTLKMRPYLPKFSTELYQIAYNTFYPDYYRTFIRPLFEGYHIEQLLEKHLYEYYIADLNERLYYYRYYNQWIWVGCAIINALNLISSARLSTNLEIITDYIVCIECMIIMKYIEIDTMPEDLKIYLSLIDKYKEYIFNEWNPPF